ncbi:MAG: hypothetical protein KDH96_10915, partial [Candidatus Riesia sp.]|nr:hypothetical protein [Candidatus Riesia sp.]
WTGRLYRIGFADDDLVGVLDTHGMSVATARGFARHDRPMGFERLPKDYEAKDMLYEMNQGTPIIYTNCPNGAVLKMRQLQRADRLLDWIDGDE